MNNGGITEVEMVEMCNDMERRLIDTGDPFCGDDWALYQIVKWALKLNERVRELEQRQ